MQKELNPELFGTFNTTSTVTGDNLNNGGRFMEGSSQKMWADMMEQSELRVAGLTHDMREIKQQMKDLITQFSELFKNTQSRMDRLQQAIQKLDANDHLLAQEISNRVGQLHSRIGERKQLDMKMQEMVDRHNSVLKSFEVRLQHMQKILSEKEGQLLQTTAALNDAKMEISRLKRL